MELTVHGKLTHCGFSKNSDVTAGSRPNSFQKIFLLRQIVNLYKEEIHFMMIFFLKAYPSEQESLYLSMENSSNSPAQWTDPVHCKSFYIQ